MTSETTPPPWGSHGTIHYGEIDGPESFKLVPLTDYRTACRAVNREAAGEALGIEVRAILPAIRRLISAAGDAPLSARSGRDRQAAQELNRAILDCGGIGALDQALAAWEAAGKEG